MTELIFLEESAISKKDNEEKSVSWGSHNVQNGDFD